jgi:hypothetical protein
MTSPKRTRPRSANGRPDKTSKVMPALNTPYPGCCTPYPYAQFVDQKLVELTARHRGKRCNGYTEPMDLEAWNADVDTRNAARHSG